MKAISLICFILLVKTSLSLDDNGKLWAVLVAGSSGYYNYRHQADICHAYQILSKHGIPDEQIIVMMYDDIAYSSENPTPGIIINRPNGTDVYKGVPKDYVGNNVTPETFLNVLLGKSDAVLGKGSGKVLKSGPKDHVFINFADHGAPGLIAFPSGELLASDFMKTLKSMNKAKKYEKMVIYIEACESGSMFNGVLPNDISIYATTASNPFESSYACYFDDERQTYLGDAYSVNWMEDSDKENLQVESLNKQFTIIKKETNTSHVQHYGDLTIGNMHVGEFQGLARVSKAVGDLPPVPFDAVEALEVPLEILKRKLKVSGYHYSDEYKELQRQLHKLHKNREYLLRRMQDIVLRAANRNQSLVEDIFNDRLPLQNFECYDNVVRYFSKHCFSLSKNDYALKHMYLLVNLCEKGVKSRSIRKAMDVVCTHPPIHGIF